MLGCASHARRCRMRADTSSDPRPARADEPHPSGWDTTLEGIPCWEGNHAGWDVHGRWDTGCVRTNAARMISSTSRLSLPCHALPRWPAAPISATSAPGLGSPLPHPHQDRARPARICAEAGLTTATSAPGLSSPCRLLCLAWQIPRSRAARPHCTHNKGMAAAAEGEPAHQCRLVGVSGHMPLVMPPRRHRRSHATCHVAGGRACRPMSWHGKASVVLPAPHAAHMGTRALHVVCSLPHHIYVACCVACAPPEALNRGNGVPCSVAWLRRRNHAAAGAGEIVLFVAT